MSQPNEIAEEKKEAETTAAAAAPNEYKFLCGAFDGLIENCNSAVPCVSRNADDAIVVDLTVDDKDPTPDEGLSPTVQLNEAEIELIARKLKGKVDLPYLNNAMEQQVLKMALSKFCSVAPVALEDDLFIDLVSGNIKWEDVKEDVIEKINDEICIPIIPRSIQDKIVGAICTVMFTTDKEKRHMIGRTLRKTMDAYSEEEFATMLNDMIDVPFVSEEHEQQMALGLARSIGTVFEALVPEPVRDILTNSSPEELREARQNLIDRLNEAIDIPFKTEAEEREYFVVIVDFLLKRYGLSKDTKLPEEEWEEIAKELDVLAVEVDLHEEVSARKLQKLLGKQQKLSVRKLELEAIMAEDKNQDSAPDAEEVAPSEPKSPEPEPADSQADEESSDTEAVFLGDVTEPQDEPVGQIVAAEEAESTEPQADEETPKTA